jgi:predicted transcriptional regulator
MKAEPAIFEVEDEAAAADAAAIAEGLADIEAGRVVSHDAMKRWLLSWGTSNELPPPDVGD